MLTLHDRREWVGPPCRLQWPPQPLPLLMWSSQTHLVRWLYRKPLFSRAKATFK